MSDSLHEHFSLTNGQDSTFPSLQRRGGRAIQKKHPFRKGADGVVAHRQCFGMRAQETLRVSDHPESVNELQVRPHSPPYEGGVAVPSRKSTRSEKARTGWSLTRYVAECVLKHSA